MGDSSLPKIAAAPTEVAATSTQYNAIVDTLQGDLVARNTSGTVADGAGDLGKPNSGRFDKLHLKTGMTVDSQEIDFSAISLQVTGISSGKSKDSGFPNFLTPLGATGGATNTFAIEAETTNLVMTIDGAAYTLEADLESDDLALAPSSNNTCSVDNIEITGSPEWTKTVGEYGYWIAIDDTGGIGSEIISLDGTIQCFKINNGSADEIFIAKVDTTNNRIIPIKRGIGGTDRITFNDTDLITLLKAHYIFLDNDLTTIDTTTNFPTWGASYPVSPSTGDYHNLSSDGKWYRYSGATWEALGRIYLGYAICDSADCLYVEHEDYNLAWNEIIAINKVTSDVVFSLDQVIIKAPFKVSVAGQNIINGADIEIDITTHFEDGESRTVSTWYYIYLTNTGVFKISTKTPRKYDARLGSYHPSEYWRCIGVFYNNSADFVAQFLYNPVSGSYYMGYDNNEAQYSLTTTLQLFSTNLPAIIESCFFIFYTTSSPADFRISVLPAQSSNSVTLNLYDTNNYVSCQFGALENGILRIKGVASSMTLKVHQNSYNIKL